MRKKFAMQARIERFDMASIKNDLDEIANLLSEYLESFYPKTMSRSKHTMMGPVGKLFATFQSSTVYDKEALKGYTIRVHEMTSKYPPTAESLDKLETAIDKMVELFNNIPRIKRPLVLSMLDDKVYYSIRHKQIEIIGKLRKVFIDWGIKKYGDEEKFRKALKVTGKKSIPAPTQSYISKINDDAVKKIYNEFIDSHPDLRGQIDMYLEDIEEFEE